MDKRIRVLAVILVVCFVLLVAQLNNLQVRQAAALANSPYTPPTPGLNLAYQARGAIVSSDGVVLAYSTPTHDQYGYLRHYPEGPLFSSITGYYDSVYLANPVGLESEYNRYLVKHQSSVHSLHDILTQRAGTDSVVTTVSVKLEKVAAAALAPYSQGAVVAIDPRTGAVLALYGKPTFDPNKLAAHNRAAVTKYFNSLNPNSGDSPLVNFATQKTIAPGSTFKVVTTSAIFDQKPSIATEIFPQRTALKLPQTNKLLHNFAGEKCGGNLALVLAVSCDTAYGQIGLELGGSALAAEAKAFGFNTIPPIDLPANEVSPSNFPPASSFPQNQPSLAYSAIGQENVTETALQDALVVSGIANGGTIMTPHLLNSVITDQGQLVTRYAPHAWRRATSPATAAQVRELMLGVASPGGTAYGLFPAGLNVAAKTGTAETGAVGCSSTWLVATAPAGPGETPSVAVAAVIPAQAGLSCSETGAGIAGPAVAKVLLAALGYGG